MGQKQDQILIGHIGKLHQTASTSTLEEERADIALDSAEHTQDTNEAESSKNSMKDGVEEQSIDIKSKQGREVSDNM